MGFFLFCFFVFLCVNFSLLANAFLHIDSYVPRMWFTCSAPSRLTSLMTPSRPASPLPSMADTSLPIHIRLLWTLTLNPHRLNFIFHCFYLPEPDNHYCFRWPNIVRHNGGHSTDFKVKRVLFFISLTKLQISILFREAHNNVLNGCFHGITRIKTAWTTSAGVASTIYSSQILISTNFLITILSEIFFISIYFLI